MKSQMPNPVYISYHIIAYTGECIFYDGVRTPFSSAVLPGAIVTENVVVNLDDLRKGKYLLEIDLVQEGCFWFKDITNDSLKITLEI